MKPLRDRLRRINRLFLASVAVPTLLAVLYFGLFASDIYISESRFVVRSTQRPSQGLLGGLLDGAGLNRVSEESYSVHDFILSRDALARLEERLSIRKAFSSRDIDLANRFPGLDWDGSFEALHKYYQKRVAVDIDTVSSISTLRVAAFTAADAQKINELLLSMSEQLINKLNERAREDAIRFSQGIVGEAEQKAKAAALALSNFRSQRAVFDPERQSSIQLQGVAKLQDELIATKTQLAQIQGSSPDNPSISVLQTRVRVLEREIQSEMGKVAGEGRTSLTGKAAEYERLALERTFADRQLASALASLESARGEAQRKQLYLERIVQPNTPDIAVEPRRMRSVLVVFIAGMVAWGILSLLLASVREHVD